MIPVSQYLVVGAGLFVLGAIGFLTRRNLLCAQAALPDGRATDGRSAPPFQCRDRWGSSIFHYRDREEAAIPYIRCMMPTQFSP